jgi:teichuronic acid biosynthesis glycosyltransferase TuaG
MDLVSVIIPTFNRFKCLLMAIESVKNQTYKNFEIIIVNDCSIQKEYYEYNFGEDIKIIHLPENSKKIFGETCSGYVRKIGVNESNGKYIAFLDDDDIWSPNKLELQLNVMKETGCKMSCTDGLFGNGRYNHFINYERYNFGHYYNTIKDIYKKNNSNLLDNGFPRIWNLDFLKIHNCVITSSVIVEKDILVTHDCLKNEPNGKGDDYCAWLRVLEHTNCAYLDDICFYYDNSHGKLQIKITFEKFDL